MKKKVLLKYYSLTNLGDDLFVKICSEHLSEYKISLIVNPRCRIRNLGANVKTHPYSYLNLLLCKLQSILGINSRTAKFLKRINDRCFDSLKKHHDAFVQIGGSIFMSLSEKGESIDFITSEKPKYEIQSRLANKGKNFIIGANLGPAYTESYWLNIKKTLEQYEHVCLRDYSSYKMVCSLSNVQYAPDVVFMLPKPIEHRTIPSVVISVIRIENYTNNQTIISAYYQKLAETTDHFAETNIPVTLMSFCKIEGDEAAIDKLMESIRNKDKITIHNYRGDINKALDVFASALYVVGSRFHSIILAASFGKPFFPIMYSCKTVHYLSDLGFTGKKATLSDLPAIGIEDLVHNYDNNYIIDCTDHKKYAKNQFFGLEQHLKK